MSLDNIQLPAVVLQDLFKKTLVDLNTKQVVVDSGSSDSITWLGQNAQKIAILVNSTESLYLPDNELDFLMGILTACRLTMADVALINMNRHPTLDYKTLADGTGVDKIIMFGLGADSLQLPLSFPEYQIQRYNNQVYLSSLPLLDLQADRMEKSKLWVCLKQIFSL